MLRYVGLDVHKENVQVCILDPAGKRLFSGKIGGSRQALLQFAQQQLHKTDRVALEVTTHCFAVARLLQPYVAEVVVSNPLKTKAIAEAKIKTDKVDAEVLAQLLRCDYLPKVWIPDEDTQQLRQLTHRRAALVSDCTRIKNRIHAVLTSGLITLEVEDLFSQKGRRLLQAMDLPGEARAQVDSELRLLLGIEVELKQLDKELANRAYRLEEAKLLMTLPGVDYTTALTLLAALGDIHRFAEDKKASGYLGLVPSVHQSDKRCYYGPITKRGNRHARWILVQAAQSVASHPGPIGAFFRRLLKKKNRNVAVVATAHKLVVVAYHMLKNNEPYRYALPQATAAKLASLRIRATGQRRVGGTKKGQPRSQNYGTGVGMRTVPSLPEVYDREALPASADFKAGELRMLADAGLQDFVASLQQPQKIRRSSRKERIHS